MPTLNQNIKQLESLLRKAMHADRIAIRRKIDRLKQSANGSLSDEKVKERLLQIGKQLNRSIKRKTWRRRNRPSLTYNEILPIINKKDEIIDTIKKHRVVIISGETGSGKSTQIPKFCLAAGRGIEGKIGCTQPRRIAATTIARRVAEELGEPLGKSVGYKIRFKDRTRPNSFIKFMTDGILLAETQNDQFLNQYDTIIVDEAHERSLNIDFILGIIKNLLTKRRDLKLIITSATIDTEKFSKAFDNAPVIEVSGRMYPVTERYFHTTQEDEEENEHTIAETAVRAVDNLQHESTSGDILIFMPTEQDIRETCELLEGRKYKGVTVMPLFARLSGSEQSRVFSNIPGRKIIVATNIAETSITIPGIKYVIDTGLARISQYMPRSRTTSLSVKKISQSSADQRKGRCGRVENGVCIRLFSEEDYESRPFFTPPEILRANLAEVILRMIYLRLGNIEDFPFIDRPIQKSITDGFDLLKELGAIVQDARKKRSKKPDRVSLTDQGRLMARIPLDPRLSRMLIEAQKENCLKDISVIVSALSVGDPWKRPSEKTEEADRKHAMFQDPFSDFITLLNVWNRYHETWKREKSNGKMRRFSKEHYLSYRRIREWRDVHAQISTLLKEHDMVDIKDQPIQPTKTAKQDVFSPLYTSIHKSILTGFLSNIATKNTNNLFRASKNREVMVFPGSALFNKAGSWIVAAELVETSRLFARIVANIDNKWLENLAKPQCKYTYFEPRWERNRGEVVASEQVSLFGLIIVPSRKVSYGNINPDDATDLFIRSALVEGDMRKPFAFMQHNQNLIDSIRDMENRIRRRDLLTGEEVIVRFYKKRLKRCYNIKTLRKHLKDQGEDRHLRMKQEDLIRYTPNKEELDLFPDNITLGGNRFDCDYHFDPAKDNDGLTIKVPASTASLVPQPAIDWLVPGLYREKITLLIKGLPKSYRKQLVPVADTVTIILEEMPKSETLLLTALGNFIYKRFDVDIPASAWPQNLLPDHLRARIAIIGPKGEELVADRDPTILNRQISESTDPEEFEAVKQTWEKTGIIRWDFGDLPDSIRIDVKDGTRWFTYPGLESKGNNQKEINLRLFRNRNSAIVSHKKGILALFSIHLSKDLKYLRKQLVLPTEMASMDNPCGTSKTFEKRIYESIVRQLFYKNVRTEKTFYAHAEATVPSLHTVGQTYLKKIIPVLKAYHETSTSIRNLESIHRFNHTVTQFLENMRDALSNLVPETFMELYDSDKMTHMIRYIRAIGIRIQRALVDIEKDRAKTIEADYFSNRLNELISDLSPAASEEKKEALEAFFWSLEEYKVSLFAQELKTAGPVSKKRLETQLKNIERMV